MNEGNLEIARRVIEEVFNRGKLDAADELMAPGAPSHDPAQMEDLRGPEGLKEGVSGYRAAFPDIHIRVEEQFGDGPFVATRWSATGTHEGALMGVEPTGKQATVTGITIDRIENGMIVESWTNWDTLGLMMQLGAVPMPAHA
jgi:steroid delta-isomerase-like uncharacterized protein